MKGTTHAISGVAIGFVASWYLQTDIIDSSILITGGTIASLAPDLDTQGKLTNRLTKTVKNMKLIILLIGLLAGIYYFLTPGASKLVLYTSMLFLLVSFLTNKVALTVLCAGIMTYGLDHAITWLTLSGTFILLAIYLPHRSYTHSLVGLLFFTCVVTAMENSFGVTGLAAVGIASYAGHLICDSKHVPGNKQGVKLLKPITDMEF